MRSIASAKRRRPFCAPVESLEDRRLLSASAWVSGGPTSAVAEGNSMSFGIQVFDTVLIGQGAHTRTVSYTITGTAIAGTDHGGSSSGTAVVSFTPGNPNSGTTITVPIYQDNLVEGDESVIFTVTGLSGTDGTAQYPPEFAAGGGSGVTTWNATIADVPPVVTLDSLTVSNDDGANTVTVAGGGSGSDDLYHEPISEDGSWATKLKISASLNIDNSTTRPLAKYQIVLADGSVFSSGIIPNDGVLKDVPAFGAGPSPSFTVKAWIDSNQNGSIDGSESVTSLLSTTTDFHVKSQATQLIYQGTDTKTISINISSGSGSIRVYRDGQENPTIIDYNAQNAQNPFGTVQEGKILRIEILTGAETRGKIVVE